MKQTKQTKTKTRKKTKKQNKATIRNLILLTTCLFPVASFTFFTAQLALHKTLGDTRVMWPWIRIMKTVSIVYELTHQWNFLYV